MGKLEKIAEKFRKNHNTEPLIVRSPGRINLIGEHTDYNHGSVLPASIDKSIYLAIGSRQDNIISIYSSDFDEEFSASLNSLEPAWKLWPNYLLGVINEFNKKGDLKNGINIVFGGDIPLAAGLSSSAALTCAVAYAINSCYGLGYSKPELAKIAQHAEHNFVGVKCGVMDQFASLYGKEDNFIKLDCQTLNYSYIPYKADRIKIVLFDSGVKHFLVSSAYNERRDQCNKGLELVQKHLPEIKVLSEITEDMLSKFVQPVDEVVYNRCLYVIQELDRLEKACEDLKNNDFESLGLRLYETHNGLKDLYEVSCSECDYLVELTRKVSGVFGARMMGAGFGGCTLNLIANEAVDEVITFVKTEYKKKFGKDPKVYYASIGNGTEIIPSLTFSNSLIESQEAYTSVN